MIGKYGNMGLVSQYLKIPPKVQFPNKMIALTYFKTILQRSKVLLKYTDHLYDKEASYTGMNLGDGFEPVFQEY